jgi:hypothetical protein
MTVLSIQDELSWKIRDALGRAGIQWTDQTGGVIDLPQATSLSVTGQNSAAGNTFTVQDVGTPPNSDLQIHIAATAQAADSVTYLVTTPTALNVSVSATASGTFDPRGAVARQAGAANQPPAVTSRGQLVYYEAEPTHVDYGRLKAIDPADAKGIAIPTFSLGPVTPAVGTVVGETFHNTGTHLSYVWTGTAWDPITPRAEIEQWVNSKPYVEREVVEWKHVLWIATTPNVPINTEPVSPSPNWRPISTTGLVPVPSACDPANGLASIPSLNGAHAIDTATGSIYTLVENGGGNKAWVEMYGAVVEQSIGTTAPTGNIIGEVKMFAGVSQLPNGWVWCDGQTALDPVTHAVARAVLNGADHVPDLRDKFIRASTPTRSNIAVGQSQDFSTTAKPHGLGANKMVTEAAGRHNHSAVPSAGTSYFDRYQSNGTWGNPQTGGNNGHTSFEAEHTHTIADDQWDAETSPPFYALAFAIFIGI